MTSNATEIVSIMGNSIDMFKLVIGSGIVGAIFTLIIRYFDTENKKKATLYYPLYMACNGIIKVIKNHDSLGSDQGVYLFLSSAKTLNEIVFNSGSVIYLKGDSLKQLLSMKSDIDEHIQLFETRSWEFLEDRLEDSAFQNIAIYAESLKELCQNNVKDLSVLSE